MAADSSETKCSGMVMIGKELQEARVNYDTGATHSFLDLEFFLSKGGGLNELEEVKLLKNAEFFHNGVQY